MTQNFWDAFWANLFASLSVVVILTVAGYLAKHKITRNLKKFIANEVDETIKQIKEYK
jgi:hypothetical protein